MFKKLNETLQQFLEDDLHEISYETKKSYLAKRKAQLDAAQKAFDKANRMIKRTELAKDNKIQEYGDLLELILKMVKNEGLTYNDKPFGYIETFKTWAYIQTGEVDSDSPKNCRVTVSYKDGYLKVFIKVNKPWREYEEAFNMSELSSAKLMKQAASFIIKTLKALQKQENKVNKFIPKIEKTIEQIKNVLSKAKEDKIAGNKYEENILYKLGMNGRRKRMPAVISVTAFIPNIQDPKRDKYIKAIALDNEYLKLTGFYVDEKNGFDIMNLELQTVTDYEPEGYLKALTEILDQLKGIKGKSTLKTRQKELEENKKIAAKAAEELRAQIKLAGGYGCEVQKVKENGNSFEILTFDFGVWGDSRDWEEDNDFMRPTKETIEIAEKICKDFSQKYKTLKFSYGISEKRMLSFYVEYTK